MTEKKAEKKLTLSQEFDALEADVEVVQEKYAAWQIAQSKADAAKADYELMSEATKAKQVSLQNRIGAILPNPANVAEFSPRVRQA